MDVRNWDESDYEEICRWWNSYEGWQAIPVEALPCRGWVIEEEGNMLCAGFLYNDPSSMMSQMEWIVANPDNSPRKSFKALNLLIEVITDYSRSNGFFMFTSVCNKGLIRIYEKCGLDVTETGMSNMLMRV